MNRDKIGIQTCYIHQCTYKVMLMCIACLCPNLVSVHFYAIPILHSNFLNLYQMWNACTQIENGFQQIRKFYSCTLSYVGQGSRMQGKGVVSCKNQKEYFCQFCSRSRRRCKLAVWPISVSHCRDVFYEGLDS